MRAIEGRKSVRCRCLDRGGHPLSSAIQTSGLINSPRRFVIGTTVSTRRSRRRGGGSVKIGYREAVKERSRGSELRAPSEHFATPGRAGPSWRELLLAVCSGGGTRCARLPPATMCDPFGIKKPAKQISIATTDIFTSPESGSRARRGRVKLAVIERDRASGQAPRTWMIRCLS